MYIFISFKLKLEIKLELSSHLRARKCILSTLMSVFIRHHYCYEVQITQCVT